MSKRVFITYVLTFLCVVFLMPGLATALCDKVKSEMADLKAETAKLGAPMVQDGGLYFGKTKADNTIVDAVVKKDGGVATLFVKDKDHYVRVATTVTTQDGKNAVGTALDARSPAMAN
jgi:hypothetical protein